jgi:hypothetical protein
METATLLFKVRHTGTSPLYDFDCGFLLKHLRICICNQNLPTVKFLINITVEWHLIPVKNRLNSEFVISIFTVIKILVKETCADIY